MLSSCFTPTAATPSVAPFSSVTRSNNGSAALVRIRSASDVSRIGVHDSYRHAVTQLDVARQGHHLPFLQTADDFVVGGVGDAYANLPLFQRGFPAAQPNPLDHEYKPPIGVGFHRTPRYRQNVGALLRIDAHAHIYVRQQLEIVIVDLTQQLPHAASSPLHYLLGDYRGPSDPGAVGQRIPGDFDRLVGLQPAQLRLVDEGPHADPAQIGHFRKQIS